MTQVSLMDLIAGAKAGKVVSFPTDTVPALAALPEKAELIFTAKKRQLDKPLILMAAEVEDFWQYVEGNQKEYEIWQKVAKKYLPGALTLVLPASSSVAKQMNPYDPTTIGLRVPNSDIARKILAETGPLATTSANLSGQVALEKIKEIDEQFPDVLVLVETEISLTTNTTSVPSTVAKWLDNDWQILRQGPVILYS
jgi:L-threonylcarbamoyladenylate synthase